MVDAPEGAGTGWLVEGTAPPSVGGADGVVVEHAATNAASSTSVPTRPNRTDRATTNL